MHVGGGKNVKYVAARARGNLNKQRGRKLTLDEVLHSNLRSFFGWDPLPEAPRPTTQNRFGLGSKVLATAPA